MIERIVAARACLLGLGLLWSLLGFPRSACAERAALLFVGPELRARSQEDTVRDPRYELTLPHGLVSKRGQTALLARVGLVLPDAGGSLAFPVSVGLRYAPFESALRPMLGSDFGGYFVQARGSDPGDAPKGPQWCWSVRALGGAMLRTGELLAVLVYVDAMWAQTPEDARSRDEVFSSLGAGVELRFAFASPRLGILDMLLHGTAAPEGF